MRRWQWQAQRPVAKGKKSEGELKVQTWFLARHRACVLSGLEPQQIVVTEVER